MNDILYKSRHFIVVSWLNCSRIRGKSKVFLAKEQQSNPFVPKSKQFWNIIITCTMDFGLVRFS